MIREIEVKKTPYERYFILTEAPVRRPYMRVVTANPDGRLSQFDDNIEDPDAEAEDNMELVDDDETDFDANVEDLGEDDAEATNVPLEEDEPQPAENTPAPAEPAVEPPEGNEVDTPNEPTVTAGTPEDTGAEPAADEGDLATDPPEGNEGVEPIDADATGDEGAGDAAGGDLDTEDPNAGGDFDDNIEDTGDETGTDDAEGGTEGNDAGGNNQQGTTPNTAENQLKFTLFKNLKNLYLAIKSYEESLDDLNTSSINYNSAIKVANKKLADLEELIYEYMTIRFRDEPYLTSMEFYQKCLVGLQFIFELLRNNKEVIDSNDKTIN